jgi:hypothetical protein
MSGRCRARDSRESDDDQWKKFHALLLSNDRAIV